MISDIFNITLDELIASGNPTHGESRILTDVACGRNPIANNIDEIIGLAPYLKPSVLERLSETLQTKGIDISNIIELARYLNDESVVKMLKKADFSKLDDKLLEKLIPLLDDNSKGRLFQMILDGEIDWHMIRILAPYMEYMHSQIEAAVVEGSLPYEALEVLREAMAEAYEKSQKSGGT